MYLVIKNSRDHILVKLVTTAEKQTVDIDEHHETTDIPSGQFCVLPTRAHQNSPKKTLNKANTLLRKNWSQSHAQFDDLLAHICART